MGMDLYLSYNIITQEEYEKLKDKKYLINKYDQSLKDKEEILVLKEAYYFEMIKEIFQKNKVLTFEQEVFTETEVDKEDILFSYLEQNEEYISNKLNLNTYIPDDLYNYISFEEWKNYKDCEYPTIREVIEEEEEDKVILIEASYS